MLTSVPTAAERGIGVTGGVSLAEWLQGSGGSAYQIYDPTTGDPTTGQGRTPFANNFIPTSKLSPQAMALLNYFPLPNTGVSGSPYINNYAATGVISIIGNQWNTRWDYYGSEKDSFFGRYSYADYGQQAPGAFGLEAGGPNLVGGATRYAGNSTALNQSLALGWTHTTSPTVINEVRFGYMRYHVNAVPNGYGTTPATAAGIPGLNLNPTTSGMPNFFIDQPQGNQGFIDLGYGLNINGCNCPLTETESQYQWIDNLTKIAGNHTFKFGADVRYALNLRVPSDAHRAGILEFQPEMTGDVPTGGTNPVGGLGLASFLLGDVSHFERYYSTSTNAQERQRRWFFYGQDEWHVTHKLTFTYGLRWELIFPESVNIPGNGAMPNLSTGQMYVYGVDQNSASGYERMNYHNFAPRAAIAYQVTPKTVVRAGYGWSYNLGTFGSTFGHVVTQNPPVLVDQQLNSPNNYTDVFTLAQGPPAPESTHREFNRVLYNPRRYLCKGPDGRTHAASRVPIQRNRSAAGHEQSCHLRFICRQPDPPRIPWTFEQ